MADSACMSTCRVMVTAGFLSLSPCVSVCVVCNAAFLHGGSASRHYVPTLFSVLFVCACMPHPVLVLKRLFCRGVFTDSV